MSSRASKRRRADLAARLGIVEHGFGDAVFDRTGRIEILECAEHAGLQARYSARIQDDIDAAGFVYIYLREELLTLRGKKSQ